MRSHRSQDSGPLRLGNTSNMHELIAPELANRILLFLAVTGPLAGLIIGIMIGAHEKCAWPKIAAGVLLGAIFSVTYGMWRLYGAITDRLGIESIANLVLELVLFAVVGVIIAAAASKITQYLRKHA